MRFGTESGDIYTLTNVNDKGIEPVYYVEELDDPLPYFAEIVAPRQPLRGVSVRMLIQMGLESRRYKTTDPVEYVDFTPHQPTLGAQIIKMMEYNEYDFITTDTLSRDLSASKNAIENEIEQLGHLIRRPLVNTGRYSDWYRLVKKGPTAQEEVQLK